MRRPISDLYDLPGTYLIDHPEHKKKVAAIVAGLTFVALPVAAEAKQVAPYHATPKVQRIHVTPGGIKEYKNVIPCPGGIKEY